MPKYFYECKLCDEEFSIWHNMSDAKTDCPHSDCMGKNSLIKIPSLTNIVIGKTDEGEKVEEFIKDSTSELREYKEKLRNRRD